MNMKQKIGMAGELLVASKLFRRGYDVSITLSNTKAIDLFVYNPTTQKTFPTQVKTLQRSNCFPIHFERIHDDHVYVFALLQGKGGLEEFFIVMGRDIRKNRDKYFGTSYTAAKITMPAINIGPLRREHQDKWEVFHA